MESRLLPRFGRSAFIPPLLIALLSIGPLLAADHTLRVTPQTIAWGYYWSAAKPVLTVKSGDTVEIQTVSGNPQTLERARLRTRFPRLCGPSIKRFLRIRGGRVVIY